MLKAKPPIEHHPDLSTVNIHIYPSPFKNESRMLKITKTLSATKVFDKIFIFATLETGLLATETLDETREVIRIRRKLCETRSSTLGKAVKTLEWSLRISRFLHGRQVNCINCHSLPVLPLCVLLKFVHRSKLIYDTHELETETAGSSGFRKYIAKIVERVLIRFVDETIVVNESLAEWYQRAYRLSKVWVVRNFPYRQEGIPVRTNLLREAFGIREDEILFLFQGAMGYGRAIELLIKIFSKVSSDKHVVFMGDGELAEYVKMHEKQYPNIHYHPAVKPNDIIYYTGSADIGLSLTENVCLSHYLSTPNKIFEYVNCGLPIIVSDFPNMAKFIDDHKCGWKVRVEEKAVTSIINAINLDVINEKRTNALCAKESLGWHLEEPRLISVYKKLGF